MIDEILVSVIMILVFLIFLIFMKTPARVFLRAALKKQPVYLRMKRVGVPEYVTPSKIEQGKAIFKGSKHTMMYCAGRDTTIQTNRGKFGIMYDETALIVPPEVLRWATELKAGGFGDFTEAQIAYGLHQIEKQFNEKIVLKQLYEWTEYGERTTITGLDLLKKQLDKIGTDPWAITDRDIMDSYNKGYEDIEKAVNPFMNMSNFFKYNGNPADYGDWISSEKTAAREIGAFGAVGDKAKVVIAIATALVLVAVGLAILSSTGTLDQLGDMMGTGGSAVKSSAGTVSGISVK